MSSADREQNEVAGSQGAKQSGHEAKRGGREAGQGGHEAKQGDHEAERSSRDSVRGTPACELRPFAHPVDDAVLLAALERAERHNAPSRPGALLRDVFAHMGFLYNGAATRQLRPQLEALIAAGAIDRAGRPSKALVLTRLGRRRLEQIADRDRRVALPESPQHRRWRHSRSAASERIDGYGQELHALLAEATALLDAGTRAQSDAWFCVARRLSAAAVGMGAAVYCLMEWPEPDDARADVDDYSNPGDGDLNEEERADRRSLRVKRRRVIRPDAI